MSHIKLKTKNVFFNPHAIASDTHGNKTYFCYASLSSCQAQVEKILNKGNLPKTAEIKGRENIDFKLSVYQDDGYWFQSPLKEGKRWRLWVPFKDKTNLKNAVDKVKKTL